MGASSAVSYVTEMPYLVRLHVYSGRLDPIWALADADAERLLADLSGSEADTSTLEPGLGYRGFSLSRSAVGSDEGAAGGDSDVASPAFNGCWSHKPGQASVADLDNAGKRIGDPRLADRGPYQTFCGYKSTDRNARIA